MKALEREHAPSTEDSLLLQPRLLFLPPAGCDYERSYAESSEFTVSREDGPEYDLLGCSPVDPALFWYRWIAGHQVSFILWRTIGGVVRRHTDELPPQHELDVLAACVDGYSAMLLYASTVPRDHYHAHTRVRMAEQHPSFSGRWAPDYRPLLRIFMGRLPWQCDPSCAAVDEAIALNRKTHDHIADHLVPDGRSLLQKSARGPADVSREKEDLYDNFFLTIRRTVSHTEIAEQLDMRIAEIADDLAHNGLYPNVDGAHFPVLIGAPCEEMEELAASVPQTLRRAALLTADLRRPLAEARR